MTKLEFTCSDEKSVFLLKAARLYDEGVKLEPVRHGEWITTKIIKSFGTLDGFKCSLCGKERVTRNKFCPNCGAKMDGDKDAAD